MENAKTALAGVAIFMWGWVLFAKPFGLFWEVCAWLM